MLRLTTLLTGCLASTLAMALHLDIAVSVDQGKLKTDFCFEGGDACDELPALTLLGVPPFTVPIDIETGKNIFVSDFSVFQGGPEEVDDPGFYSGVGQLPPSLRLSYRALGHLQYWDPVTGAWSDNVPGVTHVELFGGIYFENDQSCGALICPPKRVEGSTLFTPSGIGNRSELIIGDTDSTGVLHVHRDWVVRDESAGAVPERNDPDYPDYEKGLLGSAKGAYMVEMQVIAPGYEDSEPFFIMFARALSAEEMAAALAARITQPDPLPTTTTVPIPGIFFALLFALITVIAKRRL